MTDSVALCELLVDSYREALGKEFSSYSAGSACVLVTPFRRPDGEYIELEAVIDQSGTLRISDMGASLAYLDVNGLTLSRTIGDEARRICKRHAVEVAQGELFVTTASPEDYGSRVHALLHASLNVSDMIQRRRPSESVQFPDLVEGLLVSNRMVYDSDVLVSGKVVKEHRVRFKVEGDERPVLIQPISAASEGAAFSWAERWAFRFADIHQADQRPKAMAILDDRGDRAAVWTPRTLAPLRSQADVVFWRDNAELLALLPVA